MLFPVLAIEGFDDDFLGLWFQATDVDVNAVGIGARDIKWLDAAGLAKGVFGHTGVKGVGRQILFTLQ